MLKIHNHQVVENLLSNLKAWGKMTSGSSKVKAQSHKVLL